MKKLLFFMTFLLFAGVAGADTVYLKSGATVTGKIVEKSDASVLVDVGGATVTYYKDEIDRIDDTPALDAAALEPVTLVPAAPLAEPPAVPAVAAPVAAVSAQKRDLIMKFIDVFGTRASMKANFEQMMSSLSPEESAKLRDAFNVDAIIEELVPLYDKYMSEDELKAYIDFYSSEAGKKLVATIPLIMRGSVEVSAKYFETHMPEEFRKAPSGSASTPGAANAPEDKI